MRKLEKLGFNKDWLTVVKHEWKPKKCGQYDMLITYIEDLSDDPAHGVRIERTKFDNDYDLSLILKYFEGNTYVIKDVHTKKVISKGIIDYSVFDDMHNYTQENWDLYNEEEIQYEQQLNERKQESLIDRLMFENQQLKLENAKLRLQLKEK